jgi:hypothetical protein
MLKGKTMPFALGAVFALIVGSGTAYAATGGNLILGKYNEAGATTTLKSTKGAALALKAKSNSPVLKVSNSKKIAKLNADKLDGYSSGDFIKQGSALNADTLDGVSSEQFVKVGQTPVGGTGQVRATGLALDLNGNGITDAVGSIASCPVGSSLTGGGGVDATDTGYLLASSPTTDSRGWLFAVGVTEGSGDTTGDTASYAMCWGANGKPAGTTKQATTANLSGADLVMLREARAGR